MSESWRTRLMRWGFNVHPTYWCTGGRVTYIAGDWREVRVRLPLAWRTRNYVGTMFGGSMYSAVDPFYMIMLIKILGPEYIVWDKAAAIRFRRPGQSTLTAKFVVDDETVEAIRRELNRTPRMDFTFTTNLMDQSGTICAVVEKTIHVSRKSRAKQEK